MHCSSKHSTKKHINSHLKLYRNLPPQHRVFTYEDNRATLQTFYDRELRQITRCWPIKKNFKWQTLNGLKYEMHKNIPLILLDRSIAKKKFCSQLNIYTLYIIICTNFHTIYSRIPITNCSRKIEITNFTKRLEKSKLSNSNTSIM